jgi:CDP-paratose 2-epimerase
VSRNGNGRRGPVTLVTGGAGFVGTNLADRLVREGRRVRVVDNLSRSGVERNLRWLTQTHGEAVDVLVGDVRDRDVVRDAVSGVDAVFHLAAQVAVTTSVVDPLDDFATNVEGTLLLLEALRRLDTPPPVLLTSTNKVYGTLADVELRRESDRWEPVDARLRVRGVSERRPLDFCTPYGCSKGAADQYVLDYAKTYGVPAVVFRMSCIYGPHQHGTEDQGWVAHFLLRALAGDPITVYGDGAQVRDLLYVDDLVEAMLAAERANARAAGNAFNMGGGPANALSLLEVLDLLAGLHGDDPDVAFSDERIGDQRWYVSDTRRFAALTGWRPRTAAADGIDALYEWLARTPRPRRLETATG